MIRYWSLSYCNEAIYLVEHGCVVVSCILASEKSVKAAKAFLIICLLLLSGNTETTCVLFSMIVPVLYVKITLNFLVLMLSLFASPKSSCESDIS